MGQIEQLAEGITLYLGDCREILPTLLKIDAVVTDPPYGIGFEYASYNDTLENWRDLMTWVVDEVRHSHRAACAVMPSCQIAQLPWIYATIPPDWLISWYKGSPGHCSAVGFNDWEPHLVYGKTNCFPIHDFFQTDLQIDINGHPCVKPLAYSKWLVSHFARRSQSVADPFMGSGTTGVAAVKLGRKFIGIEIEPKYFDIACRRISEALKQPDLFIDRPKEMQLTNGLC